MKLKSVRFLVSAVGPEQLPKDGLPEIAFSGRSNVGKSSLINALVNHKGLAKTSKSPGKTRQLNYYAVNDRLYLVDLPGYGYSRRSRQEQRSWGKFVEPYLQERQALRGLVQLLDCRHDPSELDLKMLEWLQHRGEPYLVALTKSDKISASRLRERVGQISSLLGTPGQAIVVPFSAKTKTGRQEIWRWMDEVIA